jgi:hypothetical protein
VLSVLCSGPNRARASARARARRKDQAFVTKKLPPPTPDGREGRLFPPEQSWKTLRLLNELPANGNKFIKKIFAGFDRCLPRGKNKNQSSKKITKEVGTAGGVATAKSLSETGLHECASRFLVLHA